MNSPQDIYKRSYTFALNILRWVRLIQPDFVTRPLINQLIRSSTSIGANLQEASAASSKKDFVNRVAISLREARETNYWLKLLRDSNNKMNTDEIAQYIRESEELSKILATIKINTQKHIT